MCQERIMRQLRFKYHITYPELAKAAGVSRQRIAQLELNEEDALPRHCTFIRNAFYAVALDRQRQVRQLEIDLDRLGERLMEYGRIESDGEFDV